ncbi:Spc98 family-domain-containing protein [Hysterangium stoloniferum]|nr:Spc98 family-domain-containing protein [Hysterangium stoloniferum]
MDTPITRSTRSTTTAKIAGTIASVRKQRQHADDILGDDDLSPPHASSRDRRPQSQHEDNSFVAESSFLRAPLNSRVEAPKMPKSKGKARQREEESLDGVTIEVQEAIILEELLSVLMGIPGTYITYDTGYSLAEEEGLQGAHFVVSSSADPSLRDLTTRILPLATSYTAITAFIEQRSNLENGLINHALCASIRTMLKDYHTLISQLEHAFTTNPQFSLQKLWFYVHPTLHTLSLLHTLIITLTRSEQSPFNSSSEVSSSSEDEEERARNEALGLGSDLKKIVKNMTLNSEDDLASRNPPKGGEVLARLHKLAQSHAGDPKAQAVYGTLIRDTSKPYARVLRRWCERGYLEDPYDEFMIRESRFIDRGILERDYVDEYWERRYTLRDGSTSTTGKAQSSTPAILRDGACVPPLLEPWKHKVLLAGKYLNVIRECGIEIGREYEAAEEGLSMDDERFYKSIEDAYSYANRTLLKLLLDDQQLIPRLRSLKHYFFLSQSFYLTHFLDIAGAELRKPVKAVSVQKLQTLLSVALNTDGVMFPSEDSNTSAMFRDDVKMALQSSSLSEWLLKVSSVKGAFLGDDDGAALETGVDDSSERKKDKGKDKDKDKEKAKSVLTAIDVFALDYTVKFPLSLVLSRKTILRYQLLFRFLLHLKHLEQSLGNMWLDQKSTTWRMPLPSHPELDRWRSGVFILRARMLAVIQQILAFATYNVLEPHWRRLEHKLANVTTVDQLLRDHVDFLDTCLKECMLTSSRLVKQHQRLLSTCTAFTWYTANFTKSLNQAITQLESDPSEITMKTRWEFLIKFSSNFDHWLRSYIEFVSFHASSENAALMPLVGRLKSVIGGP